MKTITDKNLDHLEASNKCCLDSQVELNVHLSQLILIDRFHMFEFIP